MKIETLSPWYRHQLVAIEMMTNWPGLWQAEARDVLQRAQQDFSDTDALMQTLHDMQRLHRIWVADLENNQAFRDDVDATETPTWQDFSSPPVADELQYALADKLYNAKPGTDDSVILMIGDTARKIGPWLVDRLVQDRIPLTIDFNEPNFHNLLINHASEESVKRLGTSYVAMADYANKRIVAVAGMPEIDDVPADKAKSKLYKQATAKDLQRRMSGELFYTGTSIPTRKNAEIDAMSYEDNVKLFFEMVDQPWPQISQAQQSLIKEFNAATKVHITNSDGTDISMELVDTDGSHFTFCNSLIAKNVPGSEIFSAPRRDSVNGTIVAKGRFSDHGAAIVEDLTLHFNKGRLESYTVGKGMESFERSIGIDDGARFVGEIGIGTNPHLKRHVVNGLLVEKIGGSFHIALGRPYSYTSYEGVPVKVNNGGQSDLHWDITTMLHGKDGRIELDGRAIMENGQWLDQKYDVLNRGWESIPVEQRPDYWKDYYKSGPKV